MAYNELFFTVKNVRVKSQDVIGEVAEYDEEYDLYHVWTDNGGSVISGWFKEDDLEPVIYS